MLSHGLGSKGKGQLSSERVQNPHDPEATYAVKGRGQQLKEHVGYKVQVAETVSEARLAPGEPTQNFLIGIVTHPAHQSDEVGALEMEQEQAAMGFNGTAPRWSASTTRFCRPGGRSNGPKPSSNG